VQPWSCTAAPIHDPITGCLLGALDVTGGDTVATPQAMGLVQATVFAVEADLRMRAMEASLRPRRRVASPRASATVLPRLNVLGAHTGTLQAGARQTALSLRHSEILLILASHPEGLTTDQLAVELNEEDLDQVTVRAEISRLRRVLGELAPVSRPYRLPAPLATDADLVRQHLRAGDIGSAVAAYAGPVLPRSDAPGVLRTRRALADELRAAVLAHPDPNHLLALGRTPTGHDDVEVWQAAADRLPAGSADHGVARLRLRALDEEYGLPTAH
jgi:hypothetical protein